MPLTDLETALQTHRVIFAADLSARKGEPVRLSKLSRGTHALPEMGVPRPPETPSLVAARAPPELYVA
jgi:hypothetical protein